MAESEVKRMEKEVAHLKVQMLSQQRAMAKATRLIARLLDRVEMLEVQK
jgi:hypothetical protein